MAYKSKDEIEREAYQKKQQARRDKLLELGEQINQIYKEGDAPGDVEEIIDDLGIFKCYECESFSELSECNVCSEKFCEDCASDHASEETGL